jgi:hypothetical protein
MIEYYSCSLQSRSYKFLAMLEFVLAVTSYQLASSIFCMIILIVGHGHKLCIKACSNLYSPSMPSNLPLLLGVLLR